MLVSFRDSSDEEQADLLEAAVTSQQTKGVEMNKVTIRCVCSVIKQLCHTFKLYKCRVQISRAVVTYVFLSVSVFPIRIILYGSMDNLAIKI